jgi:hypothetical protein
MPQQTRRTKLIKTIQDFYQIRIDFKEYRDEVGTEDLAEDKFDKFIEMFLEEVQSRRYVYRKPYRRVEKGFQQDLLSNPTNTIRYTQAPV